MTNLRKRAEAFLDTNPEDTPTLSTADVKKLVHELQVHQVELEMQNEELRQAQAELADSRDRYVDLYELAPVGYVTLDRHRTIREANLTICKLLGFERTQVIGRKIDEFTAPEHRDDCFRHFRAVLQSQSEQSFELRFRHDDDHKLWGAVKCVPCEPDSSWPDGCRAAINDITERKQAEEALRVSEEKLALAASGTRVGIFDRNIATGAIAATEQNVRLLGLRTTTTTLSQDYRYPDWAERVHPEDLPRVEAEMDRCMRERAPFETEYRVVWPDGSVHWLAARGVFLYDVDGRPRRMLGILMDITGRKNAEEQIQRHAHELEAFNRRMVGRELRMVELKKEVNALCKPLGRPPEYPAEFLQEHPSPRISERRAPMANDAERSETNDGREAAH